MDLYIEVITKCIQLGKYDEIKATLSDIRYINFQTKEFTWHRVYVSDTIESDYQRV